MTTNKKPAPGGTGTGSNKAFSADHSTSIDPCWLLSFATTASCLGSMAAAPLTAALSVLIDGGVR